MPERAAGRLSGDSDASHAPSRPLRRMATRSETPTSRSEQECLCARKAMATSASELAPTG